MKQRAIIAIMACATLVAPAHAQFKPMTGWSLGLNLQRSTAATYFGGLGTTATLGDTDLGSSAQASYGFAMNDRYRLGLGLSLGLSDMRAGTAMLAGNELSFRLRNMYSLYAEPGYALGQSTLLYGKVSYLGGRGEESYGGELFGKTYAGLGLGAGVRTMLGESLYLQVELLYGDYEWKTSRTGAFRPTSTSGSVGLGWRF